MEYEQAIKLCSYLDSILHKRNLNQNIVINKKCKLLISKLELPSNVDYIWDVICRCKENHFYCRRPLYFYRHITTKIEINIINLFKSFIEFIPGKGYRYIECI